MAKIKPFLKYPGNKYKIVESIKSILPKGKRLIEPFTGSGAVFLNTNYKKYILNDINEDIIILYDILHLYGKQFINHCGDFWVKEGNTEKSYYKVRSKFNDRTEYSEYDRAAAFVYLNRHGFNGLCRYNKNKQFNVPYGKYKKPYFPRDEMTSFFKKSKKAVFSHVSFEEIFREVKEGDVIYCDPPYLPLSKTSSFSQYSGDIFSISDHKRLVKLIKKTVEENENVAAVVSNHKVKEIFELYKEAKLYTIPVRRMISANGDRKVVDEVLAVFMEEE